MGRPATSLAITLLPAARLSGFARSALLVLAGTALLAISARIEIPFRPVPMTLQTLAVMFIAGFYGFRLGVATVLAYLFEAAIGLPVLAGGASGVAHFFGPTAGFMAGFVVSAMVTGAAVDAGLARRPYLLFPVMLCGEAMLFVLGIGWLASFATLSSGATGGIGFEKAWLAISPFAAGDLVKTAIAALSLYGLQRIANR